MRFAYLTLDEVNQHQALTFAGDLDVLLDIHGRPEALEEREYDAMIYDPASFPPSERHANLMAILACPVKGPVAVHSYDFTAEQIRTLRKRGVLVSRRLRLELFVRLRSAVRAFQRQQNVA